MSIRQVMEIVSAAANQTGVEMLRLAHAFRMHDGEGWVRKCPDCVERLRAAGYDAEPGET